MVYRKVKVREEFDPPRLPFGECWLGYQVHDSHVTCEEMEMIKPIDAPAFHCKYYLLLSLSLCSCVNHFRTGQLPAGIGYRMPGLIITLLQQNTRRCKVTSVCLHPETLGGVCQFQDRGTEQGRTQGFKSLLMNSCPLESGMLSSKFLQGCRDIGVVFDKSLEVVCKPEELPHLLDRWRWRPCANCINLRGIWQY